MAQWSKAVRKFTLFISGQPVPKGRPRMSRYGGVYTPKRTQEAEENIASVVALAMRKQGITEPFDGPCKIEVRFYMRRSSKNKNTVFNTQRPDLDNLEKLLLDACSNMLWYDDSQVVWVEAVKMFTPNVNKGEGIFVCVSQLERMPWEVTKTYLQDASTSASGAQTSEAGAIT